MISFLSSSKLVLGTEVKLMYPKRSISFAQIFQAFANFFPAEDVAILNGELRAQGVGIGHCFVVLESDATQLVAIAFLDRHGDIDGFPGPVSNQRNVETLMTGVMNLSLGILTSDLEVAAVLVVIADPLGVFFEFGGVVGLGEQVFEEDRVRDADRLQVLHRGPQSRGC